MEIKGLFEEFEKAETRANMVESEWEKCPENEDLERAFDEAYKAEFAAREALVAEIKKITNGQIDTPTVNAMLAKKRTELRALVARIA